MYLAKDEDLGEVLQATPRHTRHLQEALHVHNGAPILHAHKSKSVMHANRHTHTNDTHARTLTHRKEESVSVMHAKSHTDDTHTCTQQEEVHV